MVKAGMSFWASTPGSIKKHLYFVLTDPNEKFEIVMANMTTVYGGAPDQECFLEVGDHPVITRRSYLRFRNATLGNSENLWKALRDKTFYQADDLPPEILQKIVRAAKASKFISERCRVALSVESQAKSD